jgi:hypothetical protein
MVPGLARAMGKTMNMRILFTGVIPFKAKFNENNIVSQELFPSRQSSMKIT